MPKQKFNFLMLEGSSWFCDDGVVTEGIRNLYHWIRINKTPSGMFIALRNIIIDDNWKTRMKTIFTKEMRKIRDYTYVYDLNTVDSVTIMIQDNNARANVNKHSSESLKYWLLLHFIGIMRLTQCLSSNRSFVLYFHRQCQGMYVQRISENGQQEENKEKQIFPCLWCLVID